MNKFNQFGRIALNSISWVITIFVVIVIVFAWFVALIIGFIYFTSDEYSYNPSPINLNLPKFSKTGSSHIKLISKNNLGQLNHSPAIIFTNVNVHFFPDFTSDKLYLLNNSENIKIQDTYDVPQNTNFRDIKIQGHFIYIGTDDGLKILDISNFTFSKIVGAFNTPNRIFRVVVKDNRTYLVDDRAGFYILDTSDITHPQLISYFKRLFNIYQIDEISIVENLVYVNDCSTISILDFSNISSPKLISSYKPRYGFCPTANHAYGNHVAVIDHLVFMNEAYKSGVDPVIDSHLSLLDVSNPSQPVYLGSSTLDSNIWSENASFIGTTSKLVYLRSFNNINLMDFSNPKAPVELGSYELPDENPYYKWDISLGENNLIYVLDEDFNFYTLKYEP
jgi:hypothetical protein